MEPTKSGTISILQDLASQIAKSALMAIRPVRRWRLSRPRTSFYLGETDAYLEKSAFLGLNLLLEHAGGVKDKAVCEIGAGDFLSSGLSILAAGAKNYTVIDRFPGNYSGETAKQVYVSIAENWDRYYPDIAWDSSLVVSGFPENCKDRIDLIGEAIETADSENKFDIICSFQVGEHVTDINAFAEIHNRLLKDDGVGLHRVDMSPHDVWSLYRDPTTFLRFSDPLWKMTGSNRGIPNRRRHHEFLAAFKQANLETEVLLTESFEKSVVDLKRVNASFQKMPEDSVLTKTAIYRLRKRY